MDYANLTDRDLYDSFRGLDAEGKAVSSIYGKDITWSYLIPIDKIEKMGIYVCLSWVMLALSLGDPERMKGVNIQCLPEGGAPFLVECKCIAVKHDIIDKLKKLTQERWDLKG